MSYKLIKKAKEVYGAHPVSAIEASLSPLFVAVSWQQGEFPLHIFGLIRGRHFVTFFNEKEYFAVAREKFRKCFEQKITVDKLEEEYRKLEIQVADLYKNVMNLDLTVLSDEDLTNHLKRIDDLYFTICQETLYIEALDYEKVLQVIGSENKEMLDSMWERAVEAIFISFEGRRLKIMLDLIASHDENIIRKAKFIFTDYVSTKSDGEIVKTLDEIKAHFPEKMKEVEHQERVMTELREAHEQWLTTLDPQTRNIALYVQLVMNLRDIRKDMIAQMQTMINDITLVMLKRSEIDISYQPLILLYEYVKGIPYINSIKSNIEARKEGCIYLIHPDRSYGVEPCDYDLAIPEVRKIIEGTNEKSDVIKGQIACKGKVTGTVRVIYDPHDDKGFQEGDILVTSMTRPEFVPIMKKAGAVVTNEGGITCHAAIVSRELNIPCIIGTKVATQVLKDGMMVEVDAEKGVVTILK